MTMSNNENENDNSSAAAPPCPTLFEAPETAFFRAVLASHVAIAKRKLAQNRSSAAAAAAAAAPAVSQPISRKKKAPPPSSFEPISEEVEDEENSMTAAATTTTNKNNKRKKASGPRGDEKRQRRSSNQGDVIESEAAAASTTRSTTMGNTASTTEITPQCAGNNNVSLVLAGDETLVSSRISLLFQQLVPFHDSDRDGLALGCKYCSHKIVCNVTLEYLMKCGMNQFTSHLCGSNCSATPQDIKNVLTAAFKNQTRCPNRTEFLRRVMERMQEASNQGLLSSSVGMPSRGNPRFTAPALPPDAAAGRKIKQESLTAAAVAASTRRSTTKGGVVAGAKTTTRRGRKSNDDTLVLPGDEDLVGARMILLFQQLIPLNSADCKGGGTRTGGLVLGCKYCSRKIMGDVTLTCLSNAGAYRFSSHFWNWCSHTPQDVKNALTVAFKNEKTKCPNRTEFYRRIVGRLEASGSNGNRRGRNSNQESISVPNNLHSADVPVVSSSSLTSATNKGKAVPTKIKRQRGNKSNGTLVLPGDEHLVCSRIILLFQQLMPFHSDDSDANGLCLGCKHCSCKIVGNVTLESLSRRGVRSFTRHLCKSSSCQIPEKVKKALIVAFKDQTTKCLDRKEFLRRIISRLEASNQNFLASSSIAARRGINSFMVDGLALPEDKAVASPRVSLMFQHIIPFDPEQAAEHARLNRSLPAVGCKHCGCKICGGLTVQTLIKNALSPFKKHLVACQKVPQDVRDAVAVAYLDPTPCPDRGEFWRRIIERLQASKHQDLLLSSASNDDETSSQHGRNATNTTASRDMKCHEEAAAKNSHDQEGDSSFDC